MLESKPSGISPPFLTYASSAGSRNLLFKVGICSATWTLFRSWESIWAHTFFYHRVVAIHKRISVLPKQVSWHATSCWTPRELPPRICPPILLSVPLCIGALDTPIWHSFWMTRFFLNVCLQSSHPVLQCSCSLSLLNIGTPFQASWSMRQDVTPNICGLVLNKRVLGMGRFSFAARFHHHVLH